MQINSCEIGNSLETPLFTSWPTSPKTLENGGTRKILKFRATATQRKTFFALLMIGLFFSSFSSRSESQTRKRRHTWIKKTKTKTKNRIGAAVTHPESPHNQSGIIKNILRAVGTTLINPSFYTLRPYATTPKDSYKCVLCSFPP